MSDDTEEIPVKAAEPPAPEEPAAAEAQADEADEEADEQKKAPSVEEQEKKVQQ